MLRWKSAIAILSCIVVVATVLFGSSVMRDFGPAADGADSVIGFGAVSPNALVSDEDWAAHPILFRTMMIGGTRSRQFFHPLVMADGREKSPVADIQRDVNRVFPPSQFDIVLRDEDHLTPVGMLDHLYAVGYVHAGSPCLGSVEVLNSIVLPIIERRAIQLLVKHKKIVRGIQLGEDDAERVASELILDLEEDAGPHDVLLVKTKSGAPGITDATAVVDPDGIKCPVDEKVYPYGATTSLPGGLLVLGLNAKIRSNVTGSRIRHKNVKHVLFYGEHGQAVYKRQRVIGIAGGLRQLTSSCSRMTRELFLDNPFCPWLYDVLKKYYLRLLALDQQDQPVAMDELRCPHIVVISRALRHNGRGLANEDLVVEELRQYVKSGGPKIGGESLFRCGRVSVVELERVGTVRGQIKKIQNATVLVGARGMGLVYAAFLRNRAGLLALSGREKSAPTSVVKDNYAWYPLRAAKPSVPTVLASCPVVFPKDTSSAFAQKCLKRTINFCDIYCDPRHLVGELERLLTMMHRKIERGPQHAIYADDNLDNYLVVPKSFLR